MTPNSCILGVCTSVLFAAACASGGATTASETRSSYPSTMAQDAIPRWTCSSGNTRGAPPDGLITDFSGKGGLPGQLFSAVPRESSPGVTLSQTTEAGQLVVDVNAAPGAKPQVLTLTRLFEGCVDAHGFSGVQFSLSGSLSGCSMTYATIDPEHQYYEAGGPYPPQKKIAADEVTAVPRTITAPFLNSEIPGNPATPVDASKLAAIQWMILVPVAPDDGSVATPCTGKIIIDDVKLYR